MSLRLKIFIAAGIVLVVAILVPVIHHYQLRAATGAYIAQLKAQGEPMELAQVIPPPVPAEQNSADTLRKAAALFDADQSLLETNQADGMRMAAPGKAMICWWQPDVRDYDSTNSWDDVKTAVARNEKSFALLQQIIVRPNFDFQIKYENGVAGLDFTNFCLAASKRAALRLETAAISDLHRSDTASAVKNLRAMLSLVKAMRDERLVICELVRIAIANIALTVNWEVLQSTNITEERLAELQNDWARLDFVRSEENALEMERVIGEITLGKWRSSNSPLLQQFDLARSARESMGLPNKNDHPWDKAEMGMEVFLWRYWWSYPDELRALRGYEVLMNTMRLADTNGSFQDALSSQDTALDRLGISKLNNSFDSLFSGETDFHSMLSESIVTLAGVARKVMRVEAAKQIVMTVIALKRYRLKYGNYPPNLNSLVPEFVPAIPLDPVDGQPLRYRPNADGTFLLYSVGENGKDDGGNPALEQGAEWRSDYWQNPYALDWVWPQPATPQEIQNYYAHPPK
ncbi:MAG TPA: hypothetical protein VKS19_03065 [Verrucomicrobiae bacterium]|nr:hypothetical protein [Verrucomicrobiae bacterium]